MKIFNHLEKFQNNILFYENEDKILYKFFSLKKKFHKLKQGKLCLFISNYSSEFLMTYISLIRKDLKIMFIDPNTDKKDIKEIIQSYKPLYIFINKKFIYVINNYKINSELNENIILENKKDENYEIFKDLALLIGTSGSTGSKKICTNFKNNLYSNTKNISNYLRIQPEDITITTLPLHYTYGLSIVNTHIFSGSGICINNSSFLEKSFWEKANKFKINNFGGVPFNYEILKNLSSQREKFLH